MFDLYELPAWPVPFPRNLVGVYTSAEQLIRDLSLTKSEVEMLIDEEVICKDDNKYYQMELSPKVMRELETCAIADEFSDGLTEAAIAEMDDVSVSAIKMSLSRALDRLAVKGTLKPFLQNISKYRQMKNYSLSTECTITISDY